ncbi:permease prefix domain 1-containing protein [Butyrivibrio sp. AE3003]|uniref:permease prefix domain 1-containing protein n=1 Tax=Butyrivibrio sp. AE3003 TaxID=1496721 RepID=UPI00068D9F61|nr:permease prefix domain 1-containing protein [Butyrivibrio sp. AE3003]
MEEYIKKLLEQVRFEKAHKAIGDEIRAHIEDQAEANISEGMDKETAEKRAVEDMGDPVETGIALDKVHRPQMAWGVIVAVLAVAIVGAIFQFLLRNDQVLIKDGQYYNPDRNYIVNNFFFIYHYGDMFDAPFLFFGFYGYCKVFPNYRDCMGIRLFDYIVAGCFIDQYRSIDV